MGCPTYRSHQLFNRSVLTTSEPANIQTVLATKFADFEMATFRRANFGEMLGNGIFTTDGQPWSHYRAQLKPQFTRDQVSDLNAAEHHLGILYSALPAADDDGWTEADLLPLLYRFTMDVSTEFLFGESVNSQATALAAEEKEKAAEDDSFADAMNYAQEFIALRVRFGVLRYLFSTKRFKRACTTVQTFADRFVKIALERDQEKKREDGKYVLLDALVAETRNPVELRDQVLQTLLAGRDTTSAALSWALLLLSRDKGEYAALRGKVLAHFGTAAHPKQDLTFATLKSCKRLAYVLLETLRLYPLIPINGRGAVRDTILPTGGGPHRDQPIAVMKGEQVGYSAYVMHRRRDIWGDDAAAWRPGRWEGRKLGWEFIAFSGGPRVCLGRESSSSCMLVSEARLRVCGCAN
jgi:cytochrome P450